MSVREEIGEAAYGQAIAHLERALAGEQVSFENRFELPIGPRDLRITMIPSRGDEPGVYILGSDITEFKALQNQLEHEAAHDPLTGLPNRRAFTLRLSRELERVRQNAETLGLLFLDLDGFKRINDQLGHHVGDALLQRFASVLSAEVRPGDMVARLAGDEFTIILPALRQPEQELPTLCERLLAAMAVPADVAGHQLPLAGSIGGASAIRASIVTSTTCCTGPTAPCTGPNRPARGASPSTSDLPSLKCKTAARGPPFSLFMREGD